MSFYQDFPFLPDSNEGVLQEMKAKGETEKIEFRFSSAFDTNPPSAILTFDDIDFVTQTNLSENANFLSIKLKDRVVYTKGYIIRSRNHTASFYLKSWDLFGSFTGNSWTLLHSVKEQNDLIRGKIGRYSIEGGPFKYFKIVQTGPCNGAVDANKYRLRITYFDVFGFMTSGIYVLKKSCHCATTFSTFHLLIIIVG